MATQIKGFRELSRQLKRLGSTVGGKALRQATMSAALPIKRQAEQNAPVDAERDYLRTLHTGRKVAPGFLKRNIARKSLISRDKSFVRVMIGPTPEAFYGTAFVEVGTSKLPAQPWLRPALESQRNVAIAKLGSELRKRILRAIT